MDQFGVLIFREQFLSDEEQVSYTKNFGELELHVGSNVLKGNERRLSLEFADVSNLDQDGEILKKGDRRRMFNLGNRLWHTDSSFRNIPSSFLSFLAEVPQKLEEIPNFLLCRQFMMS